MTKSTARPLDDQSALARLADVVPSFTDQAETLALEHKTTERILELMRIIDQGTEQIAARAKEAAVAVIEQAELVDQAKTNIGDAIDAQATLVSNQRISRRKAQELADTNAGAQTITRNFRTVYLDEHPPTIGDILSTMNLLKMTIAAKDFMTLDRVCLVIAALLAANVPVILQFILEAVAPKQFTAAARGMKRNRVAVIVDALLQATKRW